MSTQDGVLIAKLFVDSADGSTPLVATTQDVDSLVHTLNVEATGVTFDGTLDPTNLALEAGNLATLRIALMPALGTTQVVAVGASHAETANTIGTTAVNLVSTTNCHVVISDTPVATTTSFYLPANVPITVQCATSNKVSVIEDSATGHLYVTALS